MKLFKTFAAAAAVITCCIGNPIPAIAGMQQFTVICSNNRVYPNINAYTGSQAKRIVKDQYDCWGMKVEKQ